MAIDNKKMAFTAWHWIRDKLLQTNWSTRSNDYDKWWDYYRGRQWEQETEAFRKQFPWRPVYNEIGSTMDEHVAHMVAAKPRHYHINIDPHVTEQRAINIFLARATAANTYIFREDSFLYGNIYGAVVMGLDIDLNATPLGYVGMNGERVLPMPRYTAYPPWQWIIDPAGNGRMEDANWAIQLWWTTKEKAKRLAGRDVEDIGPEHASADIKERFAGRTTAVYSHRNEAIANTVDHWVLGANIWFREVPITGEGSEEPVIEAKDRWRLLRVLGDFTLWFNQTNDEDLDVPLGQEVGIPAVIFTPRRLPGYLYGQSFIQRGLDIQKDINTTRARIREIEHYMSGVFTVRGPNSRQLRERIMNQRGSGIVAIPTGAKMERLRDFRTDPSMYASLGTAMVQLDKDLGVPSVMAGVNQPGTYSAEQVKLLQQAAGVIMGWKMSSYGIAMKELGDKEWASLRHFWGDRRITLDTGIEMAIIDGQILHQRGWSAEVVPEDMYVQMIAQEQGVVTQLFMQGLTDPVTFYRHLNVLTDEEKQSSLQWLMQNMAAEQASANAKPAKAGAQSKPAER